MYNDLFRVYSHLIYIYLCIGLYQNLLRQCISKYISIFRHLSQSLGPVDALQLHMGNWDVWVHPPEGAWWSW